MCVFLTPKTGQYTDVGLIEQWQSVVADVKVRKVRDEIISHEEAH